MNSKDQLFALETLLVILEARYRHWKDEALENLENDNPLQYAGFLMISTGTLDAIRIVEGEIKFLKSNKK